jgi:hypothetical protein
MAWKKVLEDKWETVWANGNFIPGLGYPDWVHVKKTSLIGEWEVGAKNKINIETMNGHFKFFKGANAHSRALKFAEDYRGRK